MLFKSTKVLTLLMLIPLLTSCQDFGKLKIINSFSGNLTEISGIEKIENILWMVEDSGNAPKIYGYDLKIKKITREITIKNTSNIDWEDLAKDVTGNLYIGDFGNNHNDRKNLAIYKITSEDLKSKSQQINPTKISFYLEDQVDFPPKHKNRNFDIEAFIVLNNHFYLFTRNRSKNFDGTTKIYKLPVIPRNHKAQLIGSYTTCNDVSDCQITSATIDKQTKQVALLSYNKIWLLKNIDSDSSLTNSSIKEIKIEHKSQKEGICFKDSTTIYITDEGKGNKGGNLYELNLKTNSKNEP